MERNINALMELVGDNKPGPVMHISYDFNENGPVDPGRAGRVPHWHGVPLDSWERVDEVERWIRHQAAVTASSYDEITCMLRDVFTKNEYVIPSECIKQAAEKLAMVEVARIEGPRITARAARRSAQTEKFSQQFRKSFNKRK